MHLSTGWRTLYCKGTETADKPLQFVRNNLEVKELIIGDGEARIRCVLVRNPAEARCNATRREKHLKKFKEEILSLKNLTEALIPMPIATLTTHHLQEVSPDGL